MPDNLSEDVWSDDLGRPAYENLTHGAQRLLHSPSRCATILTAFGCSTSVVSTLTVAARSGTHR
ncbi:MAG: hypothetical protein J07HX5_00135 [halophilic archaeon J07HX5]|nr:MAG: hypothetical protein J07HX5_00135 [halophilic archaeon J07HX5]